jgi:hypothetical protein
MTRDVFVTWSGEDCFPPGWRLDLYQYIERVGPDHVALGNLPVSVRTELDKRDGDGSLSSTTAEVVATMLVAAQRLSGRNAGEITNSILGWMVAAYVTDLTFTADPGLLDAADPGAGLVMRFQPNSKEPFQMAAVLRQWQRNGFPSEVPADEVAKNAEAFSDRWFTVPDLGYFVSSSRSANGRFRLGWSDGELSGAADSEQREPGRWVLLDRESVVSSGRIPRPNGGAVSDVGRFVCADSTFDQGLVGDFRVIEWSGNEYLTRRYSANLGAVGISPNATYAAVSTLNSDTDDASVLAFWDLSSRSEVWRRHVNWIFGDDVFQFDEALMVIWAATRGQQIAFHFDGRVGLDLPAFREWLRDEAAPQTIWTVVGLRQEELGDLMSDSDAIDATDLLNRAVERSTDGFEKAGLLRLMGELAEDRGWIDNTVRYWRQALELNPNVGVKRKLKKLDPDFASTPLAKGQLVARLDGGLRVAMDWKAGVSVTAMATGPTGGLIAGLATVNRPNLVCLNPRDGSLHWEESLSTRPEYVVRYGAELLIASQGGTVGEGECRLARWISPGQIHQLAVLPGVTTGAPVVMGDSIVVGCRDGVLYSVRPDGKVGWQHNVPDAGEVGRAKSCPYQLIVNPEQTMVLFASWGSVTAIDRDGRVQWQFGRSGQLGFENYGLLVDKLSVGPEGQVLIQRRNLRITLRQGNGESLPLNQGGNGERDLKAVDWARSRIWARDKESLVMVDLNGRLLRRNNTAAPAWIGRSTLRSDGGRLAVWDHAKIQLFDEELELVGAVEIPEETIRVTLFTPDGDLVVGTSKRILRLEETRAAALRGPNRLPVDEGISIPPPAASHVIDEQELPVLEGDERVKVVGESYYQDALLHICGGKTADGEHLAVTATLRPEPMNPYDPNAVAVYVHGLQVGHLARTDAEGLHVEITRLSEERPVTCRARIRGGWRYGDNNEAPFGVELYFRPSNLTFLRPTQQV